MKKVRIYQRKDRPGFYIEWRENGRRFNKQCNTKQEAEQFAHLKYMQLNNDVYTTINMPWDSLKKEYLQSYDIRGLSSSSKYKAKRILKLFEEACQPQTSQSVNQKLCDLFILKRHQANISRYTINDNISRLKSLINYMQERGYNSNKIKFTMLKVDQKSFKVLTNDQIKSLFKACQTQAWRIRILLSLVTGLRKNDIDNLKTTDIDLNHLTIDSKSQKTKKVYIGRPLPKSATGELARYLKSISDNQDRLFSDTNIRKEWDYLRNRAKGCSAVTRQDLRKTFATLMQKIGSIQSAQQLLEHYSPKTTTDFYSDQELILRWKVEQLPVKEWLDLR